MKQTQNVANIGEMKMHPKLQLKTWRELFWRPRSRWEDITKMDLRRRILPCGGLLWRL